jgi:DNA-binding HxlR family transcriptional regulator
VSNRSAVSWRDYRVEWLLTPSEQSFSCIMERLQSWVINTKWAIVQLYHGEITELSDCQHQVSNHLAVSWRDYSGVIVNTKWAIVQLYHGDYRVVDWLLTPSKQSFSCIMERLQSWWVIVNTKWSIVQLYHREITELLRNWWHQVSNRSAVSWRYYRVEWLLTPSEQSFSCIMERLQSWVINTECAIV